MCGITGFIDFQSASKTETLKRMTDALFHRGPDGSGMQFLEQSYGSIGLGHRRLSIIDLSENGSQPMCRGGNWLTFNGEIYNHQSIRVELEKMGYVFDSGSDTEMILHAFHAWGIDCIQRFVGMFAFALFDASQHELYVVRDRAGVKPLFLYESDDLIMFASELKAFHQHPSFTKEIDHDAVAAYFQYGNIPTPHCIYRNCRKIRPGHYVKIDLNNRKLQNAQYWNVYDTYNRPKLSISLEDAKEETKQRMVDAFRLRMVSDVPVGIFLSGGYDSVAVTAILQAVQSSALNTFTIAVPDLGLNRAPYAKEIASFLGTQHTEIDCSVSEALSIIPQLPFFYDEPFADSSAIPTMLVSKHAREKVTVALSADGGDEFFAGYNRYDYLLRFQKQIAVVPAPFRKLLAGLMHLIPADRIPFARKTYNFHQRYEKLKMLIADPSAQRIMLSLSEQFTDAQWRKWMHMPADTLSTAYQSKELQAQFSTPLSYMMAIDYQTYLVDDILQKVDRATMAVGLEGREPFLDHRLLEWVAQLPDGLKYRNGTKKFLLKEIVHDLVPSQLMQRPKMGFAIPIGDWLRDPLRDMIESELTKKELDRHGFISWKEVEALKTAFYQGRKELSTKLWYLLMFQLWYKRWHVHA